MATTDYQWRPVYDANLRSGEMYDYHGRRPNICHLARDEGKCFVDPNFFDAWVHAGGPDGIPGLAPRRGSWRNRFCGIPRRLLCLCSTKLITVHTRNDNTHENSRCITDAEPMRLRLALAVLL